MRKTRHWMMPSMVSPARQKVPVRWRPLRPTAEAVTQAPGGALNKRSRESIAKHTSSPRHYHSRTSLSHCLSVYYICVIFTNHYLRSIVTSTYVKLHKFILYSNYYLFVQLITESPNKSDSLFSKSFSNIIKI